MKDFFIGDPHFGHFNCIAHDKRPFSSVEEMNACMVERWNSRVTHDDRVYVLGDMAYAGTKKKERELIPIIQQLNGEIVLVRGNHDYLLTAAYRSLFSSVQDYLVTQSGEYRLVLFHYPIACYYAQHRGAIHIYAHVHNNPVIPPIRGSVCVSACRPYMDYTPRTLEELMPHILATLKEGGEL